MKKFFLFIFILSLFIGIFYGYNKLKLYQEKNGAYFLFNSKTNIFNKEAFVFASLYDFFRLLQMKQETSVLTKKHVCLFKSQIFKKNKLWQKFDQQTLEKMLNQKCNSDRLLLRNKEMYLFNNFLCSKNFCYHVSFYYDDFIITADKTVLKKNDNQLIKIDYDQFMKQTFGFQNPKKSLIVYSPDIAGIGNQLFRFWSNYVYALKKRLDVFYTNKTKPHKYFHLPNTPFLDKQQPIITKKCQTDYIIDQKKESPLIFNNPLSYKNLIGFEKFIIQNTKFKIPLTGKNKEIADQMKKENAVSIHIRRGDFITENYKILNLSYYQRAVQYMNKQIKNPHYYVFSDDITWAKENLKIDGKVTFVDWTTKDYEDLQLMTKTKHNIIANSTFSWWGAFLNPNKEKIVLIPKTGFYNKGWEHMKVDENWIVVQE